MPAKSLQATIYPAPNLGLIQVMTSAQAGVVMFSVATRIATAYRATAPRGRDPEHAGTLARSARASIRKSNIGRYKGDRWVGVVEVTAYYAVWNLTGAGPGMHRFSTGNMPRYGPFVGDYTFNKIIKSKAGNPK